MNHEIKLYDVIGEWGIRAADFANAIPQDAEQITVRINSPGGSVADGLAMYNYLRDHQARVTTVVDGYAASAASLVMLAGDVRQVHAGSIVMVHNPWVSTAGNAAELRKTAADLDEVGEAMMAVYLDRTGIDRETLDELFTNETYMRGTVARELGFADAVIDDKDEPSQAAAFAAFANMIQTLNRGDEMSTTKTRKEIVAERDELNGQLVTANATIAEQSEKIEALTIDVDAGKATIDAIKGEHELALAALREEHEAAIAAKDAEIAARNESLAHAENDLSDARLKLEHSEARLERTSNDFAAFKKTVAENPAMAHAALDEEGKAQAAIDAEADDAEAKAAAAAEEAKQEPKTYAEVYHSMPQGKERVAYLKAHERDIFTNKPLPTKEG